MSTVGELFDALMSDRRKPGEIIGEDGLLKQQSKKPLEQTRPFVVSEHQIGKTIFY